MPTHIILWYSTFTQIYTHWPDRNAVLASRQSLLHINWMFPSFRVHVFVFLYTDVSWLWYSVMFCIPIFHDFVTMCLLYIPIFHDFGSMCCSIYRYSVTLLLCNVLYQDIPWLCYYVLFYNTDLVCYTYFHWFFNPECQHIFGKQTGYIFQSPKTIKIWTTKHYASLNQWYNTE